MGEYTTISSKGQLVIPRRIREQANWNPGNPLEIVWTGEKLELRKAEPIPEQPKASVVRELLGKYRTARDEGELIGDNVRDMRIFYEKVDP